MIIEAVAPESNWSFHRTAYGRRLTPTLLIRQYEGTNKAMPILAHLLNLQGKSKVKKIPYCIVGLIEA